MKYSAFTLLNYRCFKNEQILKIALPDGQNPGSGLTYVVGGNNVGKTSLLEAMQFQTDDLLRSSEYNRDGAPAKFIYKDETDKPCRTLTNRAGHYLLYSPDNSATQESLPYFVPSRRYWQTRVQANNPDEHWLLSAAQRNRLRMATDSYTEMDVASLLKKIEADEPRYNEFVSAMQVMIPDFKGYATAAEDYEYIEYFSGDDRYKSSFSGDGISSLARIVANIILADDRPVIIDEPELSLHPTAKRNLAKFLGERSTLQQIIIATHDPYFVQWEYIKNGAQVNRLTKDDKNSTTIHHLGGYSKYESLLKSGENWQKPQMLDLLSKEIFFYDNVLFLEGQEDVGLFRKEELFADLPVNIFDYGIGGFSSAEAALALAKDLGIEKAATIIDNGASESSAVTHLQAAFPNYKIIQWEKGDIRDKIVDGVLVKEGYFDEHGILKEPENLGDFHDKIDQLRTYFSTSEN